MAHGSSALSGNSPLCPTILRFVRQFVLKAVAEARSSSIGHGLFGVACRRRLIQTTFSQPPPENEVSKGLLHICQLELCRIGWCTGPPFCLIGCQEQVVDLLACCTRFVRQFVPKAAAEARQACTGHELFGVACRRRFTLRGGVTVCVLVSERVCG